MPDHSYLGLASAMHRLTEPAIRAAISALPLASLNGQASRGLDAACGNGDHSLWLAQALLPEEQVMGLDICREGLLRRELLQRGQVYQIRLIISKEICALCLSRIMPSTGPGARTASGRAPSPRAFWEWTRCPSLESWCGW